MDRRRIEKTKRPADPYVSPIRIDVREVIERKKRLGGSLNDSVRGHYIANPNKALFSGTPSNFPATFASCLIPPKLVPLDDPCQLKFETMMVKFATTTSSNQIETASWPVFPLRTWPVTNDNSTTKNKNNNS